MGALAIAISLMLVMLTWLRGTTVLERRCSQAGRRSRVVSAHAGEETATSGQWDGGFLDRHA